MVRSIPLRRSLLANLVFLVVAFGGATWLAMLWGERRIVEAMCRSSISQTLDLTEQRLNAFFDPILRDVELLRFLGDSGELNTDDSDRLRRLLIPLLRQNPQVSGVMIADSRGREFYLTRTTAIVGAADDYASTSGNSGPCGTNGMIRRVTPDRRRPTWTTIPASDHGTWARSELRRKAALLPQRSIHACAYVGRRLSFAHDQCPRSDSVDLAGRGRWRRSRDWL